MRCIALVCCVGPALASLACAASAQDGVAAKPQPAPRLILRLCVDPDVPRCSVDTFDLDGQALGKVQVDSRPTAGLMAVDRGSNRMEVQLDGRAVLVPRLQIVLNTRPKAVIPGPACTVTAGVRSSGCEHPN